jgi:hypothetical protein
VTGFSLAAMMVVLLGACEETTPSRAQQTLSISPAVEEAASPQPDLSVENALSPAPATTSSPFSCSIRKTCPQMTSCEEAYFYLNTCGDSARDGDKDGVPCEDICPGG